MQGIDGDEDISVKVKIQGPIQSWLFCLSRYWAKAAFLLQVLNCKVITLNCPSLTFKWPFQAAFNHSQIEQC